jgi:hypothetical protein
LITSYLKERVVYFSKLKIYNDLKFILKIGYTNDIEARNRALITQFGASVFLDIFKCHQNHEFELFLKRHPDIKRFTYADEIIPGVKSSETYLLTKEDYDNIITKIVKKNVDRYNSFNPDQYIQMKKLETKQMEINLQMSKLDLIRDGKITGATLAQLEEKAESSSSDESESTQEPTSSTIKFPKYGRTNTIQRKVQQYDPATFKLIKTYEGLMDVIRCNPKFSKFGVKKAAEDDMVYCDYRWFFIEPDAEIKEYTIPPTVESQASSIPRMIAFLNKEKTKIEKVYPSQHSAGKDLKMRIQTINEGIKSAKLVKQTYFICFYDDLSDELKNEYLSHSELPKKIKHVNSTGVQQIDPTTKKVIKTYESIADVLKEFYMSRASLKRAMETNVVHQDFLWRSI